MSGAVGARRRHAVHRSDAPHYLSQITNAHREVYALYEIARTFGSSLDIEDTVSVLVNKVGGDDT